MAQYSNLKAYIEEKIYENGTQAITGDILQDVLKVMTDDLGEFYQTGGVASPSTDPGTPDAKVIYFATEAGTYTNFGGITLAAGEVALLVFDTSWTKETLNVLSSANGGVKNENLADGAVTTPKIANGAVEEGKIADASVTSGKLGSGAVTTEKIADGAATTDKLADKAVATGKLGDKAVTSGKIADKAVGTGQIADEAITEGKIADDAVTSGKIAENAVTTAKIDNGAVTEAKIQNDAVKTAKIGSKAVTTAKIADKAVTSGQLGDKAVTTDKIADGAVGSDQLAEGAFSAQNLADGSVTTDKLADNAVTAEKIADGAVTAGKFANGSVTTIKLGSGAVTTEKIGDGMVTRQKLADSSVGTSKIIDGAVTGAKLQEGVRPVINVNALNEQSTAYGSAALARAAVPSALRILGLHVIYLLAGGWFEDEFIGSDVSGWGTASNWRAVGPVSVSQNTSTGHTDITVGGTTTPVASVDDVNQTNAKLKYYFSPVWRDGRRLSYVKSGSNGIISIIGSKTAPAASNSILYFSYKGVIYTILESVTTKTVSIDTNGNNGLFIPLSNTDVAYSLDDIVCFADANEHTGYLKIAALTFGNPSASDLLSYHSADDILLNESVEPRIKQAEDKTKYYFCPLWRDKRRIVYTYTSSGTSGKIEIFGTKTASGSTLLWFYYKGIAYTIKDSVASKTFNVGGGNAGLFIPLSSIDVSYDFDDIVCFADANEHSGYLKIVHITFGSLGASDIFFFRNAAIDYCQKELKDDLDKVTVDTNSNILNLSGVKLELEANETDFNYVQSLIIDGNIESSGILSKVTGRSAVFFKMAQKGIAPVITSDASPVVYQWYSGNPDYIAGSNSLGRTTTNTPPSDAEYCGLTFTTTSIESIVIGNDSNITRDTKGIIVNYSSAINNSIGENCFANGLRTNLKILGYGNSFMRNSVAYLSALAKGCGVNLTVGNLYTGGTELQNHLIALQNNSADYEWHKYVNGVETQTQASQTPMRGLLEERWDAILVHQYIPWEYPFEPTLNKFLKLIIERLGYTPKIYINSTWAGSLDENETYYGYATEAEMWEAMLDYVKEACEDAGVQEFSIIPTGTAIQNARTLSWADSYSRFVNVSPDLHHLNPAGGFIAAATIFQKIVTPLNGVPCSDTTFRITSSTALPPSLVTQEDVLVTDDNYQVLCQCAIDAVNSPYTITQQ